MFAAVPTVLIAGKAAPGYDIARLMIKLINDVGEVINHDPATKDLWVFLNDALKH